ncbi:hypothetical protein B0T13DRAFT_448533 [Neurospora crassa]|nr:hypothetical protein B0T13DRAFT_448533 [Neurospora crassa]
MAVLSATIPDDLITGGGYGDWEMGVPDTAGEYFKTLTGYKAAKHLMSHDFNRFSCEAHLLSLLLEASKPAPACSSLGFPALAHSPNRNYGATAGSSPFLGCVSMPANVNGGICGNCAWFGKSATQCTSSATNLEYLKFLVQRQPQHASLLRTLSSNRGQGGDFLVIDDIGQSDWVSFKKRIPSNRKMWCEYAAYEREQLGLKGKRAVIRGSHKATRLSSQDDSSFWQGLDDDTEEDEGQSASDDASDVRDSSCSDVEIDDDCPIPAPSMTRRICGRLRHGSPDAICWWVVTAESEERFSFMRLQVVRESLQALEMANIIRQDRRGVIAADGYEPTKEELQKFGRLDPIAAKITKDLTAAST